MRLKRIFAQIAHYLDEWRFDSITSEETQIDSMVYQLLPDNHPDFNLHEKVKFCKLKSIYTRMIERSERYGLEDPEDLGLHLPTSPFVR